MKLKFTAQIILIPLAVLTAIFFLKTIIVYAATTPSLGTAATFGVLSSTFTRNVGLTAITGDLGYTTLSGSGTHTVTGSTHVADDTYSSAGTDQGSALTDLAAQTCNFSFGSPTDLSLLSQPLTPGVYCITAATSIGTGGITLSGSGTYIFRVTGALTTVDSSVVTLSGGASACDVFWTPTEATTLGANTTFKGTVIDDAGITIGNTTSWSGRALAFGGTVVADTDTIAVPSCVAPTATPTPTSTPTPTPLPGSTPTPTPLPGSTPTPTPTPTPTSVPSSSTSSSSNSQTSSSGSSTCTSDGITTVPTILEARRAGPTSIFVKWGPNAGLNDFMVQYGYENGKWLFNNKVTGFSTTINNLPANQSIWIQVAATDNCAIGTYGASVLVGGTPTTNSPGFPNTGNPLLPDTGIGPNEN